MVRLPEPVAELRESVREFMQREFLPVEDRLAHDAVSIPEPELTKLRETARSMGLWGLYSPAEHGGRGLSLLEQAVVAEESAKCRMGAYAPAGGAFGLDPPNVIFDGSPEQIALYGEPAVREGSHRTFVAVSESTGGSDPVRNIETTAVRDGDTWVLNGKKKWISGPDTADWGLVFARTAPGRDGISCFIVETDTPGFSTEPLPVIRAWYPCEITLEDCRIPAENLLGEEGKGFQTAQRWLVAARVPYAANALGIASAALQIAIDYATERELFGSLLSSKQSVQWMLVDSEIELRAARLLVWDAAAKGDAGEDYKTEASIAKVVATETAWRVVDRCIQICGALGVSHDFPLERWYRELRIKRIGEGPSEVHRMVVARHLLGSAAR